MPDIKKYVNTWDDILSLLEGKISPYAYKNWFKGSTAILSLTKKKVEIGVPNSTYKRVIKNKFGRKVQECLCEHLGEDIEITYSIFEKLSKQIEKENNRSIAKILSESTQKLHHRNSGRGIPKTLFRRKVKKVRLSDVVVGSFNKIAVSVVKSLINGYSECPNPLLIYGDSGMGKTFLLQMIYTEINANKDNERKVILSSSESFMNNYVSSLQHGGIEQFREYFRTADVFMLDDVHFLASGDKSSTKEEFLHTFNELLDSGKQIIITCDKHPISLKKLGSRLVKRLVGGMWVELHRPNMEKRTEILKKKSKNIKLSEETWEYIASEYNSDIMELCGALTTVINYCNYSGEPHSLSVVKRALGRHQKEERDFPIGLKNIVDEVCAYFSLEKSQVFSHSRNRTVSGARHISVYLCHKYVKNISLGELAVMFNNSRPAILYAGNKIARAVKANDPIIKPAVTKICEIIESRY